MPFSKNINRWCDNNDDDGDDSQFYQQRHSVDRVPAAAQRTQLTRCELQVTTNHQPIHPHSFKVIKTRKTNAAKCVNFNFDEHMSLRNGRILMWHHILCVYREMLWPVATQNALRITWLFDDCRIHDNIENCVPFTQNELQIKQFHNTISQTGAICLMVIELDGKRKRTKYHSTACLVNPFKPRGCN